MKIISGVLAFMVVSSVAIADELPQRKAGLWEIVSTSAGAKHPATTQRVCLDRETDALLNKVGLTTGRQACLKNEVHVAGNRVTIHSVCDFGGSQLTSEGVITYSGDSSFRNEVHGHFQPPMSGLGDTHTVQEGRWLSACPADMKPGDLVMTQGSGGHEIKMNLRTMLGTP